MGNTQIIKVNILVPLKHDRINSFCDSIDVLGPVLYPRLRLAADSSEASYRDFCSHAGSGSWGHMYCTVYCSCLNALPLYNSSTVAYIVQPLYSVVKCWVFRATRVSCTKMFLFLFCWWAMPKVKVKPKLLQYTSFFFFFLLLTTPT